MNAALILQRSYSLRSGHLLLLLPVLPFLSSLNPIEGGSREGSGTAALMLLVLGAVLAFALTHGLRALHSQVRKEVEQIRPAWLTAAFAVQVPLLFTDDVMFFVASCAFLAAIPFGAEFQQRTLAGLLSQPLPRLALWRAKMAPLGAALLLHWLLYLLARETNGRSTSPRLALDLLAGATVAWATTPWWTLACRGLLPGLVFSLALPAFGLSLLFGAADAFITWERFSDPSRAALVWEVLILYLALPAYSIGAWRACRRRWLHLESPDATVQPAGMAMVGSFLAPRARPQTPRWNLLLKELRLQAVTWFATAGTLALLLWSYLARQQHWSTSTQELADVTSTLGFFLSLLLASALPIAEERHHGMLDALALQPSPALHAWLLKLGLALATAWILLASLFLGMRSLAPAPGALHLAVTTAVVFTGLFASSAAPNGLRALLSAVLLLALATSAFVLAYAAGQALGQDAIRALQESASNDPAIWMQAASAMSAEAVPLAAQLPPHPVTLTVTTGLAALAALVLSWRNFRAPAQAPGHFRRQAALLLGLLAASYGLTALVEVQRALGIRRASLLQEAGQHAAWFATLPPAEAQLYRSQFGDAFLDAPRTVSFRVWSSAPSRDAEEFPATQSLPLPFSAAHKAMLVQKGDLPPHLREALRLEAGLPPSPPPREFSRMISPDSGLLRRYGLLAPAAEPAPKPAAAPAAQKP